MRAPVLSDPSLDPLEVGIVLIGEAPTSPSAWRGGEPKRTSQESSPSRSASKSESTVRIPLRQESR